MSNLDLIKNRLCTVQSSYNPPSDQLRAVRGLIRSGQHDLNMVFLDARAAEKPDSTTIKNKLVEILGPALEQVCGYLADEFCQIGDRIVIISKETGQAIATFGPEDLWQPPSARRSDGKLVPRDPEIRPDLVAALIVHFSDLGREKEILDYHTSRLASTEFLQQEGDPRLDAVTQKGRQRILSWVKDRFQEDWTHYTTSTLHGFLTRCGSMDTSLLANDVAVVNHTLTVEATWTCSLADLKSYNPRFDVAGTCLRSLANTVVRELITTLCSLVHYYKDQEAVPEYTDHMLWMVPHDDFRITESIPGMFLPAGFGVNAFQLVSDTVPAVQSIEVHDQWRVRVVWTPTIHLAVESCTALVPVVLPRNHQVSPIVRGRQMTPWLLNNSSSQ